MSGIGRAIRSNTRTTIALLAFSALVLWCSGSWARPMTVVESFPMVNQIMDGSATSFAIRFDGPVDHASSRLMLVTPHGVVPLRARLDSEPNTLYSAVGKLPPGGYELRWEAKAWDGVVSKGTIPFTVSAK
jgi:methionine-rich copper-binding protein CopC